MKWFGGRKAEQRFTIQGGRLVSIADNTENYIKKGYNVNDLIQMVIDIQLDKVRLAPWNIYKVVDESSLKSSYAIQRKTSFYPGDFRLASKLWTKSLEVVKNPGKWGELVTYPNDYEGMGDFVAKGCGFKLLTGNKYVWADVLDGGANKGLPNSLHVMPSQHVSIKATDGFPGQVTGYEMYSFGNVRKTGFTTEEVLHEKYPTYDYGTGGEQYYGQSKLRSALRRINRNNSAIDAAAAKFQNGGLDSIIYMDDPNLPPDIAEAQAQALKLKLIQEYTGPLNQGKITSSAYRTGVATLGLSPVDLAIIESEKWDQVMIASVFGVPPELVGHTGTKTYDNIKTAEKALTSRCALPLLTAFRDALNRKARNDWGLPAGFVIDFDMSVYTELQEDMSQMMTWVATLADVTGLPVNRVLDLMGQETIEEPEYDMPRVTDRMGQFVSDFRMNDVDNALNDGAE